MSKTGTGQLMAGVLEILQMMIEAGAEIYRAEESALRIFKAYAFSRVDVYATTSNIIVSVETEDGVVKTHTRRIGQISTDIERVHRLNMLVRRITAECPDVAWIRGEIEEIRQTPKYPVWVVIAFYGIIAGAFYVFFGGRRPVELAVATGIGLLSGVVTTVLDRLHANKFLLKFLCAFFASIISVFLARCGVVTAVGVDYIIIGNIMTLIPGIGLTNSLRDLFTGDSISGVLRLIEAALLALAIACGYIITTLLFGGVAVW